MFRRAVLAAVVVGLAFGTGVASAGNWSHPTLDAVASEVAGKPVSVWCETHWSEWIHLGDDFGEDWSFLDGFTVLSQPIIFISPSHCLTLHAILDREDVGSFLAASSLLTLAHEAVHQRGIQNEGETDCTALPLVPGLATRHLGIPATISESRTSSRWKRVTRVVQGKRVTVRVRVTTVTYATVPNPYLARLADAALRYHRAAPPEYQGNC